MFSAIVKKSQSSLPDKENFCLPKYCQYNKFYLIEELALENDYWELHYGKCTVIGKLRKNVGKDLELENIKLPNFPREYSLPEGTLSVRLLNFNYFGKTLHTNRFYQVYGEVVLINVKQPAANRIPLTAHDVCACMLNLKEPQKQQQYLADLLNTHKPAIKVFYMHEIDRAGELAERNLEIRMLSQ